MVQQITSPITQAQGGYTPAGNVTGYWPYQQPSACPGCGRCNTCGRGGHEIPSQVQNPWPSYLPGWNPPNVWNHGGLIASEGKMLDHGIIALNSQALNGGIGAQLDSSSNPMETR